MIHMSVTIGMLRLEQALSPISLDCLLTLTICETFIIKLIRLISILYFFITVNLAKTSHHSTKYTIMFLQIKFRTPRKLLSGLDSDGIMAIITQSDLIATVGQRGFWDE
jgi:hypothetical protein